MLLKSTNFNYTQHTVQEPEFKRATSIKLTTLNMSIVLFGRFDSQRPFNSCIIQRNADLIIAKESPSKDILFCDLKDNIFSILQICTGRIIGSEW